MSLPGVGACELSCIVKAFWPLHSWQRRREMGSMRQREYVRGFEPVCVQDKQ